MRAEIRAALAAGVPQIPVGKIREAFQFTPTVDQPPFLIVQEGAHGLDGSWQGTAISLDVWIYWPRDDFVNVDLVADEVRAALNYKRFTDAGGRQFIVVWQGSPSSDDVDTNFNAFTRLVRFTIYTLAWATAITFNPDPVQGLQDWVAGTFPGLGTDPATWNPNDPTPAIYWRVAQLLSMEPTNWGSWYEVEVRGHLITPAIRPQHTWIRLIVERLGVERGRVVLANGTWMRVTRASADFEADAFRAGQIALVCRFGLRCEEVLAIDAAANLGPVPWPQPAPALPGAPAIADVHIALDGATTEVT